MGALERELEEDEAKVDNILHKIIVSAQKVRTVADEMVRPSTSVSALHEKFVLLSETIGNLAVLADEMVVRDQEITEELEIRVKNELTRAIANINEIKELFGDDDV